MIERSYFIQCITIRLNKVFLYSRKKNKKMNSDELETPKLDGKVFKREEQEKETVETNGMNFDHHELDSFYHNSEDTKPIDLEHVVSNKRAFYTFKDGLSPSIQTYKESDFVFFSWKTFAGIAKWAVRILFFLFLFYCLRFVFNHFTLEKDVLFSDCKKMKGQLESLKFKEQYDRECVFYESILDGNTVDYLLQRAVFGSFSNLSVGFTYLQNNLWWICLFLFIILGFLSILVSICFNLSKIIPFFFGWIPFLSFFISKKEKQN